MADLVAVGFKMPTELRDRLKERAAAEGSTPSALFVRAVQDLLAGDQQGDARVMPDAEIRPALQARLDLQVRLDLQARLDAAEAEVARLRALSVDKTMSIVDRVLKAKPIAQHTAGPVLPATGLQVQGEARPFFRPGTAGDRAAKGGKV